jgi:D-sedoheptulose 7-phosphate isomerase
MTKNDLKEFVSYFDNLNKTLHNLDLELLKKITDCLFAAYADKKQVFTMGNGGSGANASHLVCDLNKGVSHGLEKRFKAICLNDNLPTLLAYANDLSFEHIFVEPLKNYLRPGDVVIGFSVSGCSPNVLRAVEYANSAGGITVGFTGYDGGKLASLVRHPVVVPFDDMKICEDVHLILTHVMARLLKSKCGLA